MSGSALSSPALQALYTEHHRWLADWLHRRLGGTEQAADLAQDVFVRVLRSRNVEPMREPRSYLKKIADGLVIDFFRRRAVERALIEQLAALPEPELPSQSGTHYETADVRAAQGGYAVVGLRAAYKTPGNLEVAPEPQKRVRPALLQRYRLDFLRRELRRSA